jgi:hypothetical protein
MFIAAVGGFRHSPREIKHAVWDEDVDKPLDGRRDRFRREVHDDRLAEHICETARCDIVERGQFRMDKSNGRISLPCLVQQSVGSIEPGRGITGRIEPSGIAPTATTDIGCRPLDEEGFYGSMKIRGGGL